MSAPVWIKQKDAEHNSVAVMQNLLRQLNVEVTNQTIEDVLKENPNYPSLASLSESLSDWRVENLAVRLDESDLVDVTFPVIAHLKPPVKTAEELAEEQQAGASCGIGDEMKTPRFVMVSEVTDTQARYLDTEKGWITEPREEFLRKWSGIMLLVAKNSQSGDPDYKKAALKERLRNLKLPTVFVGTSLLVLAIIMTGIFLQGNMLQWLPLFAAKLAGTVTCILLLIQLVDKENTIVNKVCNLGTGPTKAEKQHGASSCGEGVLDSKAATLFGWLSMSEVGAFYFVGGLLSIAFGLFSNALTSVLYGLVVLNILALPYTIFSIYYQATKAKQWCTLCVAVQVILWLEFAAGISLWANGLEAFNWHALTALAWGFVLPTMAWVVFKAGLGKEAQIKTLRKQLNLYQRNPAIIKEKLDKGRKVDMTTLPQEVVLGNPEAAFTVTIFSNPFCGPCQKAHEELDKLLDEFGSGVRVVFRFTHKGDTRSIEEQIAQIKTQLEETQDKEQLKSLKEYYGGETVEDWKKRIQERQADTDQRNSIALTLLAFAHAGDTNTLHQAMTAWYHVAHKTPDAIQAWQEKYPVNPALLEQMKPALQASSEWAQNAQINGTPTLFVNDREFQNGVQYVTDLKYYIRAMEEELEEEEAKTSNIKEQLVHSRPIAVQKLPQEVILGNPHAASTITVFTSPFCNPCKLAHQKLDQLLQEVEHNVRLVFRFSNQGNPMRVEEQFGQLQAEMEKSQDEAQIKNLKAFYGETPEDWYNKFHEMARERAKQDIIALTLLSLAHLGDTKTLHHAMAEWYNATDKSAKAIEQWQKKYPVNPVLLEQMKPALQASSNWAAKAQLKGTPTLIVDGRELQNGMQLISDLKYYVQAKEDAFSTRSIGQASIPEMPAIVPINNH
ncbi:MAG: thioredoxin domain-containing protein [Flammeovirgaceae bacterium]